MRNIIKKILKEEVDLRSERVKSIVNKYGFKRAIDMVVGGEDTIKQAYQDDPASYLDQFNDLTPVENGDRIYYIDKDYSPLFYYYQDEEHGYVFINYYIMWLFFEKVIGLDYKEIQDIIKNWLEETYNIKGITPRTMLSIF